MEHPGQMHVIWKMQSRSFPNVADCKAGIYDVGEANFKSSTTWKISDGTIAQEWSDMVMATNCNKTTFSGGTGAIPLADCRTNSNRASYGDLFSWCAVMRFAHVLCPAPWRVPTIEDFRNLDKAMGGSGTARTNSAQIIWYTGSGDNQWGSLYCGAFNTAFYGQGSYGRYWTQSPNGTKAYILLFNSNGYIDFSATPDRHYGFSLRCVR